MNEYIKYDEMKAIIDSFSLKVIGIDSGERNDFNNHYAELQRIREIETANGTLNDEERGEKTGAINALESWLESFGVKVKKKFEDDENLFEKKVREVIAKCDEVKAIFALESFVTEEVNELLKGIENDMSALVAEANGLLEELNELKGLANAGYVDGLNFAEKHLEIKQKMDDLKERLKDLKNSQIAKYNASVIAINERIKNVKSELANQENLPAEVVEYLGKLEEVSQYDFTVKDWRHNTYMDSLRYDKLKEIMMLLEKIYKTVGKKPVKPEEEIDLEAEMKRIEHEVGKLETRVVELEGKNKANFTPDEKTKFMDERKKILDDITTLMSQINEFEIKLESLRDKVSEEEYNKYVERIRVAREKLTKLRERLIALVPEKYRQFMDSLDILIVDVRCLMRSVNALSGKITKDGYLVFKERFDLYEAAFNKEKEAIEKAKENGEINDDQYNELKDKIERLDAMFKKIREALKNPKIVAETDPFEFFDRTIDGIERTLEALEKEVYGSDDKIKDKATRKRIEKTIIALEQEIKDVEKFLEKEKDKDPEKYEAAVNRLNELKGRLDKVSKKFRQRCPLIVRVVKSAKDFYKKHKKLCLLIAGLAAIALIHATVGPILMPAIMYGNLIVGAKVPALFGFTSFVNNILGGMIGATYSSGAWFLANGIRLTPLASAVASTSLLKGLAISTLGSTLMMAPLTAAIVIAIKKLMEKMKNRERKEKVEKEEKKKQKKEKKKEGKKSIKERVKAAREKRKAKRKEQDGFDAAFEYYAELVKLYNEVASEMTLDEFCIANEINDADKQMIETYMNRAREFSQKKNPEGRSK